VVQVEGGQLGAVHLVQLCQQELHHLSLIMEWEGARVQWHGEWHDVGEGNVISWHHEEHEVSILTATQVGGHSASIGKQLFLQQL